MGFFDRFKKKELKVSDFEGADGTRRAMKNSYVRHRDQAPPGLVREVGSAHLAGLFGALATRYISLGAAPEVVEQRASTLWLELLPFLHLEDSVAPDALAEYIVWKENETKADARQDWLEAQIVRGLDQAREAGRGDSVDRIMEDPDRVASIFPWVTLVR